MSVWFCCCHSVSISTSSVLCLCRFFSSCICLHSYFYRVICFVFFFFFFQAEDGIRDWSVTGVQTCALPIFTRANSLGQYLFVNDRPVRDKLLIGSVRAAYADYLPRDRHPLVALFVSLSAREVDVNVHPAKAEVRFRNAGLVRALIVHALKTALSREAARAATTGGAATIAAFRT